jgi:hypothetical protein
VTGRGLTMTLAGDDQFELIELECIELVRTEPRRGTIEHFYTAKPRSFIGH